MQDTESAAEYGQLYLAYGSSDCNDLDGVKVGEKVCEALRAECLNVEWDGTIGQRILVSGLDWKRRR